MQKRASIPAAAESDTICRCENALVCTCVFVGAYQQEILYRYEPAVPTFPAVIFVLLVSVFMDFVFPLSKSRSACLNVY